MKKALFMAASFVCVITLFSCKKHSKETNSNIIGSWKLQWLAEDDNENNTIDSDEIVYYTNVPNFYIIYSFNNNGTGTYTRQDTTYTYTWTVSGDSLLIHYDNLLNTAHCHIDLLNATSLQLSSYDDIDKEWMKFAKQ